MIHYMPSKPRHYTERFSRAQALLWSGGSAYSSTLFCKGLSKPVPSDVWRPSHFGLSYLRNPVQGTWYGDCPG